MRCHGDCGNANVPECYAVDYVWYVMAHAQKPHFVFRRKERAHLNRRGRQFSRLLAAEVCASAVVMLDTPCSEVVWRVLANHSIRHFPLHFPSRASPCAITFQLDSTYIARFSFVRYRPTPLLCHLAILITNCIHRSHFWEPVISHVVNRFPRVARNPKFHYCLHNRPSLAPILSLISPFHALPSSLLKIHFNIMCPTVRVGSPVQHFIKYRAFTVTDF